MSETKPTPESVPAQLGDLAPSRGEYEGIPRIRQVAGDAIEPRVKDKVVIITGANSPLGIGRAAAHQYAANGAQAIYICDFNDSHLATHKQEINSLYPKTEIHLRKLDAADESQVAEVVDHAISTYQRLDVFFANAGITGDVVALVDGKVSDFENVMRVNAVSVFIATKLAAPAMQKTSPAKPRSAGSIIGTASVAGLRSNAGMVAYSASKAAVINMMQTSSYQLASTNVRCNAICPGLIETGMTSPVFEIARARGIEQRLGEINPLKRGGVADEIARVALFLGSDEASYVNGQAWAVDGGLSAGHPYIQGKMG